MRASARPGAASLAFAWGGALLFALSLLYFLYSYLVTFGRDAPDGDPSRAVAIDVALFSAFALHHSVLARSGARAWVERLVPQALERAAYTWVASALFIVVCFFWRPVSGELYLVTGVAAALAYGVQLAGGLLTIRAAAAIDALDLAGVRAVRNARAGSMARHGPLKTTGLYGLVRHPLYFAWVLLVFGTPHMTLTRCTFAVVSTAYLAIAIPFEERSLVRLFGPEYETYRRKTRWRMVPGLY